MLVQDSGCCGHPLMLNRRKVRVAKSAVRPQRHLPEEALAGHCLGGEAPRRPPHSRRAPNPGMRHYHYHHSLGFSQVLRDAPHDELLLVCRGAVKHHSSGQSRPELALRSRQGSRRLSSHNLSERATLEVRRVIKDSGRNPDQFREWKEKKSEHRPHSREWSAGP